MRPVVVAAHQPSLSTQSPPFTMFTPAGTRPLPMMMAFISVDEALIAPVVESKLEVATKKPTVVVPELELMLMIGSAFAADEVEMFHPFCIAGIVVVDLLAKITLPPMLSAPVKKLVDEAVVAKKVVLVALVVVA
jgi:hypothetical protein